MSSVPNDDEGRLVTHFSVTSIRKSAGPRMSLRRKIVIGLVGAAVTGLAAGTARAVFDHMLS